MMTRQDYEVIAQALADAFEDAREDAAGTSVEDYESGTDAALATVLRHVMYALSADNPRFSPQLFKQAVTGEDDAA